ncbi:MAG: branched-chain amino acid ABC transporter permease [Pseudomonadota bacterium]
MVAVARSTRASRIGLLGLAILVAILASAPYWAGSSNMRLMGEIFAYIALASLWNLLAGYAGLVSVGQHAYVGLGGYVLFALAMFLGVHPLVAVGLAGVAAAIVAVPAAFLLFRLKGAYFAIGSWVLAEVALLLFARVSALGGGSGTSLPITVVRDIADGRSAREAVTYWTALLIVVVVVGGITLLLRSRLGLALTAIRDSEVASRSLGVRITRVKLAVYVAAAAGAGAVGALIFLTKLRISPDAAFSLSDWTALVIFITVIGGVGRIEGPLVGTAVFFLLRETLADYGALYLIALGVVAILIMLFAPRGLWGAFAARTGLEIFPLQRRVIAPRE